MATEATPVETIPTVITLGGVTYAVASTPELSGLVEATTKKAAQTEKTKLYSQIEALSNQVKLLKTAEVEAPAQPPINNDSFKSEILAEMKTTFEELIAPLREKTGFVEAAQVEAYRNKLLVENQGKCLPELVVGDTVAKLDAALANAKEVWTKYNLGTAVQATSTTPVNQNNNASTNQQTVATPIEQPTTQVPALTAVPTIPAAQQNNDLNINKLSQKEFAAKRSELEQKIKELVEG